MATNPSVRPANGPKRLNVARTTPNSLFLFHALRGVLIGLLPLEASLAVASILHSDRQHKFAGPEQQRTQPPTGFKPP